MPYSVWERFIVIVPSTITTHFYFTFGFDNVLSTCMNINISPLMDLKQLSESSSKVVKTYIDYPVIGADQSDVNWKNLYYRQISKYW